MESYDLPNPVRSCKVHYIDPYTNEAENGIIQTYVPPKKEGDLVLVKEVFVVYESTCGRNWENYQNYTAQRTSLSSLSLGWKKKLNWTMDKLIKQSKSKYAFTNS